MAITISPIVGAAHLVRVYDRDDVAGRPPIDAVMVLEWEAPGVCWLRGAKGDLSRRTLRELLALLNGLGVREAKAERGDGHRMPGATVDADGVSHVDIPAMVRRFASS